MHIYSALLCIAVHPKHFTIMWGGGGGGVSLTTTSVQHPLGWCDGCHRTTAAPVRSPHTSYRWRGERVIEPIKWMGMIKRPWLTRARGGNLARTPGLHPYSLQKRHGIFNDHRESGPRFNVSSWKMFLFRNPCSCGSVVEHCVSSAKGCGFNSQWTHIMTKMYSLNALTFA